MDKIQEGITGLEASNIIYGNDSFLRTLNNDAQYQNADGARAYVAKTFNALLAGNGYSPTGAVISPAYHPTLKIITAVAGTCRVLAVKGSEIVAEFTTTLTVGENFVETNALGALDARVFVVFNGAQLAYNNSTIYNCFEYVIATGEILLQPYDIGVYVVSLAPPEFKHTANTYPDFDRDFKEIAIGISDFALGFDKVFTSFADVQALEAFALTPTPLAIHFVKQSDASVIKTIKVNAKAGYNNINLLAWLDVNATPDPFVILVQYLAGALAYAADDLGIGIQKDITNNTGLVASSALPAFRFVVKKEKGLSAAEANGVFLPSGADTAFSYYYADCVINSASRLKAVNVYARLDGRVYIDFLAYASAGYAEVGASGYANYTGEYFEVKKGWNRLENITVPNFKGSAFVAVRADPNILQYQSAPTGLKIYEKSGNVAPVLQDYRFKYNIETYDFDINALASGLKVGELPSGTIEFSDPITLRNTTWKGQGTAATWLLYTGATSAYAITLVKAELKDVTLIGQSTIKASVPTLFDTLAKVQALTGLNTNGTRGLNIATSPSSVDNVRIRDFDFIGFQNNAGPNGNGAPSRTTHNLIGRVDVTGCGIGIHVPQAGEYSPMSLVHASNCGIGIFITAGNVFTSSGTFNDNAVGLYMNRAGNDSHGSFSACNWNHSKQYAIILDNNAHGETFVGCHVFEGKIYLHRSTGFTWTGGIIDAPIFAKGGIGTQSLTYTAFQSAYWNKAEGIHHNFEGETSYLKMHGNYFMFETGADDGILNNV